MNNKGDENFELNFSQVNRIRPKNLNKIDIKSLVNKVSSFIITLGEI
jgi:hypothetical protein